VHTNISPGSVTIDGSLADWSPADQIDRTLSLAGYDIYAKWTGDSVAFALSAPVAVGGQTTVWLNTDQGRDDRIQDLRVRGRRGIQREFHTERHAAPVHRKRGSDARHECRDSVRSVGRSPYRRVPGAMSALGNPEAIDTLWDNNNTTFLPSGLENQTPF
jgi:hypothetical protein